MRDPGRVGISNVRAGLLTRGLQLVAVGALYFLGARLGLELAFENRNVTAVWPPTGIAVAALLLWGARVWPAIAVGAFLANLTNGASPQLAASIAVGNTLGPLVALAALRKLSFRTGLDRVRDVIALSVVGVASMTVSASIGTASLWLNDALAGSSIASVWLLWWAGDGFGVVLFAPFFLVLARPSRPNPLVRRPLEALALVATSAGMTYAVFMVERPIAFIVSVPIVWAALHFEQTGTALVIVIVTTIAIANTVAGEGSFVMQSPTENLLSLMIFNGAVGFASMVLAAVMHERTIALEALRMSEERYRQVFDRASDLICIHDLGGRLTYANAAAERTTGFSRDRLLTMTLGELVAPESVRTVRRALAGHAAGEHSMTYEVEIVGTSGRRIALEVTSTPVDGSGRPAAVQIIGRDITSRRIAEDELRRHSLEDPLTGLPNKTLLRERLEYALSLSKRDGTKVALVLLDLDNFKDVNAAFGHDTGDAVLRELATRLRTAFREPDTVARLGGDEFAVLAPSLAPGRRPDVIVEQLGAELDAPFERAAGVDLTASVGLALAPDHADDVDGLILRADVAMHDAKRSGGARSSTYSSDLDSQSMRRFTLEDELHAAVKEKSFVLHYQPKIDVQTMRTVGVEALLRWPHDRLGSVPPSEFIPLAVAMGLMDSITDWVLEQAISQCSTWNNAGSDLDISVNLSPNDLLGSTAERIRAQLATHELPAERLTVEVSEHTARQESSHRVLARIASLGVAVSIDDFGTGSSSMAHLSRLPITELKIDRSFVSTVATDHSDRAVARSIIELAHNLGLRAVAEGVETREAYSVIEELGSDQVQGFLVCRPVPANEFESWLRTPAWSSRVR